MRATGSNPRTARAQGVDTTRATYVGMAISNALVALAGALFAQMNGFADVTIGTGTIVVGLAAVIIGEAIFGTRSSSSGSSAASLGSVLYRIAVALALNASVPRPESLRPEAGDRRAGGARADPAGRAQPLAQLYRRQGRR